MNSATRRTVAWFGTVAGLAGMEHGLGEVIQGNRAPDGLLILSWPDSRLFRVLGGEPAMTLVPNLRISGILTILVSLVFLVWATMFAQRKHGGVVLLLLSLVLLLVGGGFGPPLLGIILSLAATRITAPLAWLRVHLSSAAGELVSSIWRWSFVAALITWLMLLPGTILLDYYVGMNDPDVVIPVLTFSALGLLLLTIFSGIAHDSQQRIDVRQPPINGRGSMQRVR